MTEILQRTIGRIKERKHRIESGEINCIPTPFRRFKRDFIGVEQGKYYLVTAATKSYKSQFTSYLFLYNTILYAYNHPNKVNINILYYPLEETPEKVICRFISHLLFIRSRGSTYLPVRDLLSTDEEKPLSDDVLQALEEDDDIKDIMEFFTSHITFSHVTNPTGIYKECCAYAAAHGTIHYKKQKITVDGEVSEINNAFDYYEPNDKNLYTLIYIDHLSLISNEAGKDQRQSMNKLSSYMVLLRNRYDFTPVVIQQQAQESMDNFKLSKLRPSGGGLGDAKDSIRDCDTCLGLFVPFKFELKEYKGYNISKFRGYIVFLECLVNRSGEANDLLPLFVDGGVCNFRELPPPDDKHNLEEVYHSISRKLSFSYYIKGKLNRLLHDNIKNKSSKFEH